MKIIKKQQGISIIGLLFVLSVLGVVAIFGSQMGLGYLNQQTIKGAVRNALMDTKSNDNASPKTIKESIMTKLSVNTIDVNANTIEVTRGNPGFDVNVEYIKEIKVSDKIKIVMDLSFAESSKEINPK